MNLRALIVGIAVTVVLVAGLAARAVTRYSGCRAAAEAGVLPRDGSLRLML